MAWFRCTGGNSGGGGGNLQTIWDGSLIPNVYINYDNGKEIPYDGWSASDYIDLSDSTDGYFYRAGKIAEASYCSFYDASKNFAAACPAAGNIGETQIPNDARYVRISTADIYWGGAIFVKL